MAYEFKIGDRVEVIAWPVQGERDVMIGRKGTIQPKHCASSFTFVQLDERSEGEESYPFSPKELKLLPNPEAPTSAFDTQVGGDHYAKLAIQPLQYILRNGMGFAEGNVIKYVSRYRLKNGVEDLKKARHYLNMLIEEHTP